MVKNHLKRIAAPRTWDLKRKKNVYVIRPEPSGHTIRNSISITMLFRDMLKRAKTMKEVRYLISNKEILLNNRKITSYKASVGLMDVISIPETDEHYRLLLNNKGSLVALPIDSKEAKLVPHMIKNKTLISGGRVQLNFTSGENLIVEKDEYRTGDVLVIDVVSGKIKETLSMKKGALVYFTGGKHIGKTAHVEDIKEDTVVFRHDDEIFETDKKKGRKNIFTIGKKKSSIKLAD